jgi:hypothetical protein
MVQVGPAQIAIHQGQTVLVTAPAPAPDGQVQCPRALLPSNPGDQCLGDYTNGESWDLLNCGAVAYHAARPRLLMLTAFAAIGAAYQ